MHPALIVFCLISLPHSARTAIRPTRHVRSRRADPLPMTYSSTSPPSGQEIMPVCALPRTDTLEPPASLMLRLPDSTRIWERPVSMRPVMLPLPSVDLGNTSSNTHTPEPLDSAGPQRATGQLDVNRKIRMHPNRHLTAEAQVLDPVHTGREAESLEDAEVRSQMSIDPDFDNPSNASPGVFAPNLHTWNRSVPDKPNSTSAAVDAYPVQIRRHFSPNRCLRWLGAARATPLRRPFLRHSQPFRTRLAMQTEVLPSPLRES